MRALLIAAGFVFQAIAFADALGAGDACTGGPRDVAGLCKSVADCSGDWTFGTLESPLCADAGDSYQDPATLVCCHEEDSK